MQLYMSAVDYDVLNLPPTPVGCQRALGWLSSLCDSVLSVLKLACKSVNYGVVFYLEYLIYTFYMWPFFPDKCYETGRTLYLSHHYQVLSANAFCSEIYLFRY